MQEIIFTALLAIAIAGFIVVGLLAIFLALTEDSKHECPYDFLFFSAVVMIIIVAIIFFFVFQYYEVF